MPTCQHRSLYLLKCSLLDLADPFAGYSMFRGKFFKGRRLLVQPARGEDVTFARVEIGGGVSEGLTTMFGLLLLGQGDFTDRRGIDKPVQRLSGFILVVNRHIKGNISTQAPVHGNNV